MVRRNWCGRGGCSVGVAVCAGLSQESIFLVSVNLHQHCPVEDSSTKRPVGQDTQQSEEVRLQSGDTVHGESLGN